MYFKILGPLEVEDRGRPIDVGGAKQRALLTILLLRANEAVSRDVLIDELWGEQPPPGAAHALETHVSRLRNVVHRNGEKMILTRPNGYLLALKGEDLDLACFERLVEEGCAALQAKNYEEAASAFRSALSHWRGQPLDDVRFESFAQVEIEQLDERHAAAFERLFEAELACGRHAEVVNEIEALVRRYPLRERLRAQLMLALYRSGRQAEALDVYRSGRHALVEKLGIEPGVELRDLEQAILRQDAGLRLETRPENGSIGGAEATLAPTRLYRRRTTLVGALAGALAAAITIPILALGAGSSGRTGAAVAADSIAVIDPASNEVVADVRGVGSRPDKVVAGKNAVWVLSSRDQTVTRIDPLTRRPVQTTGFGMAPMDATVTPDLTVTPDGSAWVVLGGNSVLRIEPRSSAPAVPIRLPRISGRPCAGSLASARGSVWVRDYCQLALFRVDVATNAVARTILHVPGYWPTTLALRDGKLWYLTFSGLTGIDIATPADTRSIDLPQFGPRTGPCCRGLAAGDDAVWVTVPTLRELLGYDPVSGAPFATRSTGVAPDAVIVSEGSVWVANDGPPGTVSRFSTSAGKIETTIRIGHRLSAISGNDRGVWVAVDATSAS